MAKMTLLAMVQNILSSMDGDEVNSISDTIEATQTAEIIETTYQEVYNDRLWPHTAQLVQLTASGDSDLPTHMEMDDSFTRVEWIKYNKITSTGTKDVYADVTWKEPKDFMDYVMARVSSNSDITTVTDPTGIELFIKNDTAPTFYTSFDDDWVVFDSYDSGVDSTLQASKTQAMAYKEPVFTQADSFVPDMPSKAFPYLLAESKSVAFNQLRQTANAKEEQRSRRQRTWLSQEKHREGNGRKQERPGYGRR